jgi:hypothetical protein
MSSTDSVRVDGRTNSLIGLATVGLRPSHRRQFARMRHTALSAPSARPPRRQHEPTLALLLIFVVGAGLLWAMTCQHERRLMAVDHYDARSFAP